MVMPFALKNTTTTYKRAVIATFPDMFVWHPEDYVGDTVVMK